MTKAQINQHLDENATALIQAQKQLDFEKIWAILKPVIVFLSTYWLISKKWRTALNILIAVIDQQ